MTRSMKATLILVMMKMSKSMTTEPTTPVPLTNTWGRALRWQNMADWNNHVLGLSDVKSFNEANRDLYQGIPGSMATCHPFDYRSDDWDEANKILFGRAYTLGYKWDSMRRRFYQP